MKFPFHFNLIQNVMKYDIHVYDVAIGHGVGVIVL